eukprot:5884094-Alexandrium_andersonii.AAC.1
METAYKNTLQQRISEWGLSDSQSVDWVVCMSKRTRTACRHIAQALLKRPPPAWALKIVPTAADSTSQMVLAEKPPEVDVHNSPEMPETAIPAVVDYKFFGFDYEHWVAWRKKDQQSPQELSSENSCLGSCQIQQCSG